MHDYPLAPSWDHQVDQSDNPKSTRSHANTHVHAHTHTHTHTHTVIIKLRISLSSFTSQYMPHHDNEHSDYALMVRDRPHLPPTSGRELRRY